MAENMGLFVVEVKGWQADDIFNVITEDAIMLVGEEKPQASPRKQARGYRFNLINMFKQEMGMNPLVMDLVCYPYISKEKEHNAITSWQEIYKSIDKVWMYCLSDRFTFRQLSNPNSQLSKDGRDICTELENKLAKPVYYYIYHYNKPLNACPSCGTPWTDSDNKKIVDLKCDACRLVTDK
jgi:hypothetical protein